MSVEEQKRLSLVTEVEAGRATAQEGAALLGMSTRQFRRLLAAFQKEGAAGLVHGNRGWTSLHKTLADTCQAVWDLRMASTATTTTLTSQRSWPRCTGSSCRDQRCADCAGPLGREVHTSGEPHAIENAENGTRRRACCSR